MIGPILALLGGVGIGASIMALVVAGRCRPSKDRLEESRRTNRAYVEEIAWLRKRIAASEQREHDARGLGLQRGQERDDLARRNRVLDYTNRVLVNAYLRALRREKTFAAADDEHLGQQFPALRRFSPLPHH